MHPGRHIIMGVPGTELDAPTGQIIRDVQPAGFILFGRNIKAPDQLRRLIDDLRAEVRLDPIITIDQEGGRVSRLKECGSEPPSAKQLREKGDVSLIERHGFLTGEILRLFGFNLDLAPVLDTSYADDLDNSLKNRTWGTTADEVIRNAGTFTRAMQSRGVLACGKHFPGYSRAEIDPHHGLPVVTRSREQLEAFEWPPFRALLPEMDSLMIGHGNYPALDDSGLPSSLSPKIIRELLRGEWGYKGAVISDDLDMGAIVGHYGLAESVTHAVEAGNDFILLCHRPELIPEATKALASVSPARSKEAEMAISNFQAKLRPPHKFSIEAHAELDRKIQQLRIDALEKKPPPNARSMMASAHRWRHSEVDKIT